MNDQELKAYRSFLSRCDGAAYNAQTTLEMAKAIHHLMAGVALRVWIEKAAITPNGTRTEAFGLPPQLKADL